jgi:hypothetical protein
MIESTSGLEVKFHQQDFPLKKSQTTSTDNLVIEANKN